MEFKLSIWLERRSSTLFLKVLSYWNLNIELKPIFLNHYQLKVLSYWNLNATAKLKDVVAVMLKVLSYWNLNLKIFIKYFKKQSLKVLSYWNLNQPSSYHTWNTLTLMYYHIGI